MTHPDHDTLLRFVLQTLDEPDNAIVSGHLPACEECRELEQKFLSEVEKLQGIKFHIAVPAPPRLTRRSRRLVVVSRWAAVLATGFLLGYMTAQLSDPVRPVVVQQRLIPTRAEVSSSAFVSCQAIDVTTSP